MKRHILAACMMALLFPAVVRAGSEAKGGDTIRQAIITIVGPAIINHLKLETEGRTLASQYSLDLRPLENTLSVDHWRVVSGPLTDGTGSIVDARYESHVVELDQARWLAILKAGGRRVDTRLVGIDQLVFHEMLQLCEINDRDYVVSRQLKLSDPASIRKLQDLLVAENLLLPIMSPWLATELSNYLEVKLQQLLDILGHQRRLAIDCATTDLTPGHENPDCERLNIEFSADRRRYVSGLSIPFLLYSPLLGDFDPVRIRILSSPAPEGIFTVRIPNLGESLTTTTYNELDIRSKEAARNAIDVLESVTNMAWADLVVVRSMKAPSNSGPAGGVDHYIQEYLASSADGRQMLSEISPVLYQLAGIISRLTMLATKASDGTLSDGDRYNLNLETQELISEYSGLTNGTRVLGIRPLRDDLSWINLVKRGETDQWVSFRILAPGLLFDFLDLDISSQGGAMDALASLPKIAAKLDETTKWFHRIEAFVSTAPPPIDGANLGKDISDLFASFRNLAADPASLARRRVVYETAAQLIEDFHTQYCVADDHYRRALDDLAYALTAEVNNLHFFGYGINGKTHNNFFLVLPNPSGSARWTELDASVGSVTGDLRNIAAAQSDPTVGSGPSDNKNAMAIAWLRDAKAMSNGTETFLEFYERIFANTSGGKVR